MASSTIAAATIGLTNGVATAAPAPRRAAATTLDTPRCAVPAAGQIFPKADPASLGFDPAALESAIDFGTTLLSTSVRVYRHGCLAATSALDPITQRAPQFLASASKTVLSLVVGRAVTLGKLGLDDPIGEYLPEADADHGRITVRQLLNQTSGLELSVGGEVAGITTDSVAQTLQLPFVAEPGTTYAYAQNTLAVLARVVERATGVEFQTFAQNELLGRLGIPRNHWIWLRDRSGNTIAAGGMFLRPDAEARLGELLLRNGQWGGQQILSADYVTQATTGTAANPGYGFLTWLNAGDFHMNSAIGVAQRIDHQILPGTPRDAYGAMGALGQLIIVVPSRDLVIVRNGGPGTTDPTNPTGGLSTVESADFKELVRRITASINDMPDNTDPGPYSYPNDPSQFSGDAYSNAVQPASLIGTLLGIGATAMPGCTLLWCNGRSLLADLTHFSGDTLRQVTAALVATITG